MSLLTLREEVGYVEIRVRSCNKIHSKRIYQFLPHALCHATDDANDSLLTFDFRLSTLQVRFQFAEAGTDFLLGVVTDGTGVKEDDIRVLPAVGYFRIGSLQNSRYDLAVCDVHLATVCLNIKFFCHFML